MKDDLERLLHKADVPNPERAELLWAEYRTGGSGAELAFNTLLAWHGLAIYRRIWGFVRSDSAEDVFQEVLAKLHQQRQKLATFEYALRWLRTVAIRKCVDVQRRTTRRSNREAKRALSPNAETQPDQRTELEDAIALGLSKLSMREREAIALVYFEEMNKQDAAVVMRVHRDTLARWIAGALEKLRGYVPVPVVFSAGGTLGIQTVLSAKPCSLGLVRMGELTKLAWATAVTPTGSVLKTTAVSLGLVVTGGLAAAGWGMIRDKDQVPEPVVMDPARVSLNSPTPKESVSDRNLGIYRSEVLPKQLAALRGLVIGDGEVTFESAEAYDIRVRCFFKLRHKNEKLPGWVSGIEFVHTTCDLNSGNRFTSVYFDMFGRGERKPIDFKRPIVLWRNPLTGVETLMKVSPLEDAVAAFAALPHDDLSQTVLRSTQAKLETWIRPLLGVWYAHGDPALRCEIRFTPPGWLEFAPAVGHSHRVWLLESRVDSADWMQGLIVGGMPATFSADGRRIEFQNLRDWWSREPILEPKK